MAVTGTLVFAVLSAALSSFLFGYNIGVINAPRVIVAQWIRRVHCERDGGTYQTTPPPPGEENSTTIWCRYYDEASAGKIMFTDNTMLNTLWSLVSAIFCLGALIAAMSLSFFVNRFGRKGTMLINNVTAIAGAVCMLLSYYVMSHELLIVGRFIIGLNAGLNSGAPPMYLTEIAPASLRGAIGSVHQLVIVVGVLISQILGLPFILGSETLWPILFGFSLVPAALQLLTLSFCPESPRHLYLNRNDVDGARKALDFFQRTSDVTADMDQMKREHEESRDQPKVTMTDIFRDRFLRRIMLICIMVMLSQQFSGINAVMFYSTAIFTSAGMVGVHAQYATVAMSSIFVVASTIACLVVDKLGRRILLLAGLIGMCITTILLVVFMKLMINEGMEWASYASVFSVILFVVFFAYGPGPIPWFLASELFTQGPRAPATSVVAGVNWLSTLIITFTFPLIESNLNEYTFLIFTTCLVGFIVYTYMKVPETKGKRIDEIQAEMRQRL
ncbi:hypothetical protein RvY_15913 [Ramazzottius varieornatus]|uniref:Major facilitator superfamily (MFS) profile domain-containing protein n=1 Tax=Ramazzottius varieornatus TaxID=947166 RepID=A0A1D1VWK5_RAMVA|nr:hypothetical protein RvY_15913 [Ramazzottius varieornatus]